METQASTKEARKILRAHSEQIITSQFFVDQFPKASGKRISNLITNLRIRGDLGTTNKKGVYINKYLVQPKYDGSRSKVTTEAEEPKTQLSAAKVGESIIAYIDTLKGQIRAEREKNDKLRSSINGYVADGKNYRAKIQSLEGLVETMRNKVKEYSGKTLDMEEVATVIRKGV